MLYKCSLYIVVIIRRREYITLKVNSPGRAARRNIEHERADGAWHINNHIMSQSQPMHWQMGIWDQKMGYGAVVTAKKMQDGRMLMQ
jgi:hypothetical protein